MAVRAAQIDTASAAARFIENGRLPRPSTRTRVRREVVLRPATGADAATCALLDSTYTTTHVWQLDTRTDADELRISLRWLRLPRELTLTAQHSPPPASAASQRRGTLWLVAEEIEVGGGGAMAAGAASSQAPATWTAPTWSHAIRRTSAGSSVQLSLPDGGARTHQQPEGPAPVPGKIVGYVVVGGAPRDRNAYLRTLVVDRSHRRKGTGSKLLAEAKRWAARQGADSLISHAPTRSFPAIRLLQKAGFVFCGYNDSCYLQNEVAVFFCARLR